MTYNGNILAQRLRITKVKAKGFYALFILLAVLAGTLLPPSALSLLMNSAMIGNNGQISIPTITAASGYWRDIQSAVDWVIANGGIGNVYIPEGTFNFVNVGESWKSARVIIPAGVNLFGAPTKRDANGHVVKWKTVLVMPWEVPTGAIWFRFVPDNNKPFRISDIKMIGYRYYNKSSTAMYTGIQIYAPYAKYPTTGVVNFRIDHCCLQDIAGNGIHFSWCDDHNRRVMSGVIDHCWLVNTYGNPGTLNYEERTLEYGICLRRWACDVWDHNIKNIIGHYTNYTVFIENNYFSKWRHCVASNDGVHYVFRYNVVDGDYGFGSIDGHGSYADDSHPYAVGTRAVEVYNNVFKNPDTKWTDLPWALNIRGGSWIVTNNTLIGYHALCDLKNDQKNYEPYCPQCHVNQTYIWKNSLNDAILIRYNVDNQENVHYFLRAPNLIEDKFEYKQYSYPHPLVLLESES